MEFLLMFIKVCVSLVVIFGLMALAYKFANNSLRGEGSKRYAKVIERVQVSKDGYIVVVKMGTKGMVLSTSTNHTELLKELNEDEVREIEEVKLNAAKEVNEKYERYYSNAKGLSLKVLNKFSLKEEKNE